MFVYFWSKETRVRRGEKKERHPPDAQRHVVITRALDNDLGPDRGPAAALATLAKLEGRRNDILRRLPFTRDGVA